MIQMKRRTTGVAVIGVKHRATTSVAPVVQRPQAPAKTGKQGLSACHTCSRRIDREPVGEARRPGFDISRIPLFAPATGGVMSMDRSPARAAATPAAAHIQRKCEMCDDMDGQPAAPAPGEREARFGHRFQDLRVHTDARAAASAHELTAGYPGFALPAPFQQQMERALGRRLDGVRLHTDATSDAAARSIHAHAYTIGNDIHFAAGKYDATLLMAA
jgi:hypothetical protein